MSGTAKEIDWYCLVISRLSYRACPDSTDSAIEALLHIISKALICFIAAYPASVQTFPKLVTVASLSVS